MPKDRRQLFNTSASASRGQVLARLRAFANVSEDELDESLLRETIRACEDALLNREGEDSATPEQTYMKRIREFVLNWDVSGDVELFETELRRNSALLRGSILSRDLQEYDVELGDWHNNVVVAALTNLEIATDLLRVITRAADVDWSAVEPFQQSQVDKNGVSHIADLIYRVKSLDEEKERVSYFFIFEHKSSDYYFLSVQLLEYVALCLKYQIINSRREQEGRKKLSYPIPVVLGCYDDLASTPRKISDVCVVPKGLEQYVADFDILFFDVQAVDVDALDVSPLTKAFLKDLQFGRNPKLKDADILDIFGVLRDYQFEDGAFSVLMALTGYWGKACRVWGRESCFDDFKRLGETINDRKHGKAMMNLLDSKYYAEACRKYSAKWDAEREEFVRQEEQRKTARFVLDSLFSCLRKRLPNSTVSNDVLKKLNQIDDLQKLRKILDFSFDVPTMEDFENFVVNLP